MIGARYSVPEPKLVVRIFWLMTLNTSFEDCVTRLWCGGKRGKG
jgi:hypothetical protein